MNQKKRVREGICQICGRWGPLTKDHLPQQGLYPKEIRASIKNMNTVRACTTCNNDSNKEDELLKVIIGNLAHSFWDGKMWNSTVATLDKNKKLDRLIDQGSRYEDIEKQAGGVELVKILKLEGELKKAFFLAMERLVKGLFYQEYKEVLVINREIDFIHPDILHPIKLDEIRRNLQKSKWKSVNNGTCRYVFVEMDATDIVFIVCLFGSLTLHFVILDKRGLALQEAET